MQQLLADLGVNGSVPFEWARLKASRTDVKSTVPVLPTWDPRSIRWLPGKSQTRWSPWGGFVGLRCRRTGQEVHADCLNPFEDRLIAAEDAAEHRLRLGTEDAAVLDAAGASASFEELGYAVMPEEKRQEVHPKTAERQGKAKLRRMADRFREILQEAA